MSYSNKYPVGSRVWYNVGSGKQWGTVVAFESLRHSNVENCENTELPQVWATWDNYPNEHGFMYERDVHIDTNLDVNSPDPLKGDIFIYASGPSPVRLSDQLLIATVSWIEGQGFPPLPAAPVMPIPKVKKARR